MKNRIKYIFMFIILIISIYFDYSVYKLDLLTNRFLLIVILSSLFINVLVDLLLFLKKRFFNILGIILYILFILFFIFGIKYVYKTNLFLDESFNNNLEETSTYYIMVKSSSKYNKINDIKGKTIYYYPLYTELEDINKELSNVISEFKLKPQDDIYEGFIKFMIGKDNIIILTDGIIDVLNDYYGDVKKIVKSLYSFSITDKNEVIDTPVSNKSSFNIYLSGSDSRAYKVGNKTRSDVNMIASVNQNTHTILLTSIPRDYYVYVHGQTKMKDKLTHSGIYGLKKSKQTVEDLFNIDIDYSVKVSFNAVIEVVDAIDGIEIYSDKKLNTSEGIIRKGMNQVNGKQALVFSRERHAYSSGDNHRVQNQQEVLGAVISKITTSKKVLTNYDDILSSLSNFYITDIPKEEVSNLVKDQLSSGKKWNIITNQVTGKNSMQHCYAMPKNKLYVMIPNEKSVLKARNKMIEVLEG